MKGVIQPHFSSMLLICVYILKKHKATLFSKTRCFVPFWTKFVLTSCVMGSCEFNFHSIFKCTYSYSYKSGEKIKISMQNLAQFQQDLYKRPNHTSIQQLESSRNSGEVLSPISAATTDEQLSFPLQSSFLTLPEECWQAYFTCL